MKKKLVVLTGSGISVESGLQTFRAATEGGQGLWNEHRVEDVATHTALVKNPALVLEFYNQRYAELSTVEPNVAHKVLKELEDDFEVHIITQNVDNLHERAGSNNVVHLHGELTKVRSMTNPSLIYDRSALPNPFIKMGDVASDGGQLRPHIVFFEEDVPMLSAAARLSMQADIFVVIGTSLVVYPAASLVTYTPQGCPIYIVDPEAESLAAHYRGIHAINDVATKGVQTLKQQLLLLK